MQRFTNLALAGLLAAAIVTGLTAQMAGTPWGRIPVVLHGVVALAILVLAPWKTAIASRGLRRTRRGNISSLAMTVLILVTITSGLLQMTGLASQIGPLTMMQLHVGAAVAGSVLAVLHYRRHPVRPKAADAGRRSFVRAAGVGSVAGLLWVGWEGTARGLGWPGGERRFTGSHERGSFDPAAMPSTQWLDDTPPKVDPEQWRIEIGATSYSTAQLGALPTETITATLDCTSGWWSEQEWRCVRLDQLLDPGEGRSVIVRSRTGYSRRFPAGDLPNLWLALEVGGAPLGRGHGFPARLVAPGRRGFWWVKWVDRIEVSSAPAWLQPPFPLT